MGSRSKSEKLDKYNLFEWVYGQENGTKTHVEHGMEFSTIKTMEHQREEGNELCESVCEGTDKIQWGQLTTFLKRYYPNHHAQILGGVDDDGFFKVGMKRGNFFNYWKFNLDLRDRETYEKLYETAPSDSLRTSSRPLHELLSADADIWEFSRDERALILRHWESQLRQDWIDNLVERAQTYQDELEKLETIRSEYRRRLLEKVDVIGLTTTGLARHAPLLDRVNAKTLICEEAGEVLEVLSLCGQ